eukprot:9459692-Pyramimonas_sp.AAC.1
MDHEDHVKTIDQIYIPPPRAHAKDSSTKDEEKSRVKAILGDIGWRSEQSGPLHSRASFN